MSRGTDELLSAGLPILRSEAGLWGVTGRSLDRLMARGELVPVLRGVLLRPDLVDDLESRARALALVLPDGAAVARRTAAWLLGVDPRTPDERGLLLDVECCVPRGRSPVRRAGVRGFVTDLRSDEVIEVAGIPTTTPTRTAVDLARWLPPHMGLACLDAMAGRGLVEPEHLVEQVERWRGERFAAQARYLVGLCEPRTESYGESWTRLRVVDAGFPRPAVQVWVADADGVLVYRLDMGWVEQRVGLEYDGVEFHDSAEQQAHDRARREDLLHRLGWTVIGVGRGEVLGRRTGLEDGLGEVFGLTPRVHRRRW